MPSYFAETSYTSGRWINEAVKPVGGNVEEREEFLAALPQGRDPRRAARAGEARRLGNPIQNIYIRKIERNKDGELQNTVIVHDPRRSRSSGSTSRRTPEAARLQPRLPALQGLLGARA